MRESIDLKDIFFLLKKRFLWIVAGTVVGFIVMFLVSSVILPKMYTSSIEMYVNNNTSQSGTVNQGDVTASKMLVNTYIVILQSDSTLDKIVNEMTTEMKPNALKATLSMSAVNSTEVLRISVSTKDPQLSKEICDVFAAIGPEEVKRVVNAGSVNVIGPAKVADAPSSPNTSRNALLGAGAGMFLMIFLAFVIFLFDNTIKGEEDLIEHFDVPFLGEIPSITMLDKKKKGKGKKHHAK